MRRPPAPLALVASLLLVTSCTAVRDNAQELPQQAGSVADQAQFCFSVTRTLSGVEARNTSRNVLDAAEEVLAQAPDDLREHARIVTDALHDAADGVAGFDANDGLEDAVTELREGVSTMCAPRE